MSAIQKTAARMKEHYSHNSIFIKYFTLFAAILLIVLTILGSALTILVNAYLQNENTRLLKENTIHLADSIKNNLISQDMNNRYSIEKQLICNSLEITSNSIGADVFVADVEGNIILCRDRAKGYPLNEKLPECPHHDNYIIGDSILQQVYEGGFTGTASINGETSYVSATPIYSNGEIIGSVFAISKTHVDDLVYAVLRIFVLSALACLSIGFYCIWRLTKGFVKPLQQMSAAAKQFAIGDFSYRVKVKGDNELAELGRAFNDMADSLDALESSRRNFVSNVSHELRTPMTSIGGFIDGMLDGTIPPDKYNYYLEIVSSEVKRLTRLVVTMLNMSKIESGSFEMKPRNYDISDQIIHILLTFEQKIDDKHIEIRGLEKLKPTYIVADIDMIYQVIYNIFDNAVKFTNDGGYIEVKMTENEKEIQVSIKNSGIGIKSEELSKVFQRFYKVDKSRSLDAKGAGLGLYIVKMMVEMHSGKIWAQSENENSAEFVFTLPKTYNPIYKKEIK